MVRTNTWQKARCVYFFFNSEPPRRTAAGPRYFHCHNSYLSQQLPHPLCQEALHVPRALPSPNVTANGANFALGNNECNSNLTSGTQGCPLENYFERLYTVRRVHHILKTGPWSLDVQELLKKTKVVFQTDVVVQILRSGIAPTTCVRFFNWLKEEQSFTHTFYTYDAIIDILRDSGLKDEMLVVIEEYRLNKFCIDQAYFQNLIRWYGKTGNLDEALRIWNQLRESQATPGVNAYNMILDLLAKCKCYHQIGPFFNEMVHRGWTSSPSTYAILIRHLVAIGRVNAAYVIFRKLAPLKVKRTALMYAILLSGFASACDEEQVSKMSLEVKDVGVKPTWSMLEFVQSVMKSGKTREAGIVVKCFWPEVSIQEGKFSHLLLQGSSSFSDDEDDGAGDGGGDDCSSVDYDPCINVRALAYALKRWDSSTERSLETAQIEWTSKLVAKVICHIKKSDVARKFFNWVHTQPGFVVTAPIVSRMVAITAVNGDLQAMEHLMSKAKEECFQLSVHVMTACIKAYGMARSPEMAILMFNKIREFGSQPNVKAYANLIHALVKQGRGSKALEYFEEMQHSGLRPSSNIYVMLLEWLGLADQLESACSLFEGLQNTSPELDGDIYTAMIKVYFWNKKVDSALKVFEDCRAAGIMPTGECIVTLTKGLRLFNRHSEAALLQRRHAEEAAMEEVWRHSGNLTLINGILDKNFVEENSLLLPQV